MTARFNDLQVRTVIEEEVAWLRDQSQTGGIEALERLVAERSAVEPNRRAIYLLVNPLGGRLAGNLSFWPNAADRSGYVRFDIDVHEGGSGQTRSHPALAKVFISPAGYGLLVGRDIHDLAQAQQQVKAASFLGVGAIVVLGLPAAGYPEPMDAGAAGTDQPFDHPHHGGRAGGGSRDRGNGDEFDDLAQNLNGMLDTIERCSPAARSQRGYCARSTDPAHPDAFAHRGGADGHAGPGRMARPAGADASSRTPIA